MTPALLPTPPTDSTPASPSPLVEANPHSLDELFSRDPLDLADQDIDRIVATLRKARETWSEAETTGTTRKAAGKMPKAAKPAPTGLSIDDII